MKRKKNGPLRQKLMAARSAIAAAAQKVYDEWSQDEDGVDEICGTGGICDEIARAIQDALSDVNTTEGGMDGDDHSWIIAYSDDEAYSVDIPPRVYETGGGYSWKKIPDVTIEADDVEIEPYEYEIPNEEALDKTLAALGNLLAETGGGHNAPRRALAEGDVDERRLLRSYEEAPDSRSAQRALLTVWVRSGSLPTQGTTEAKALQKILREARWKGAIEKWYRQKFIPEGRSAVEGVLSAELRGGHWRDVGKGIGGKRIHPHLVYAHGGTPPAFSIAAHLGTYEVAPSKVTVASLTKQRLAAPEVLTWVHPNDDAREAVGVNIGDKMTKEHGWRCDLNVFWRLNPDAVRRQNPTVSDPGADYDQDELDEQMPIDFSFSTEVTVPLRVALQAILGGAQ